MASHTSPNLNPFEDDMSESVSGLMNDLNILLERLQFLKEKLDETPDSEKRLAQAECAQESTMNLLCELAFVDDISSTELVQLKGITKKISNVQSKLPPHTRLQFKLQEVSHQIKKAQKGNRFTLHAGYGMSSNPLNSSTNPFQVNQQKRSLISQPAGYGMSSNQLNSSTNPFQVDQQKRSLISQPAIQSKHKSDSANTARDMFRSTSDRMTLDFDHDVSREVNDYPGSPQSSTVPSINKKRKKLIIGIGCIIFVLILALALGLGFGLQKHKK
ncbi:unnamed protein product [Ambrosiozyma monospora]|uniref:Unnamed protein product n=1 Tax=Ambrosiozyma monospora TaxID=43982 RepID=A0A9W7DDL8_AMBMO|nr:unnamed protein product [Ambrosiozyma monospora]